MEKSSSNRSGGTRGGNNRGNQGSGKGRDPGGWPSKNGNRSGRGRTNALPKGKGK